MLQVDGRWLLLKAYGDLAFRNARLDPSMAALSDVAALCAAMAKLDATLAGTADDSAAAEPAHFGRFGTRVPDQGPQSDVRLHNEIPLFIALTTYFGYAILTVFGKLRDFFGKCLGRGRFFSEDIDHNRAPLVASWENFYVRRMQTRIKDVFSRPITGPPAASGMTMLVRDSADGNKTMRLTGETQRVINLGSYNYLGFADDWKDTSRDDVVSAFDDFGASLCSSPMDGGTTVIHAKLEALVSEFLGKEACCVFNMGYGTNASTIPALVGKGSLIVSDSLNHSSIVNGARASGAKVRVFKHDNPAHLDTVLRDAIISGQPRTKRPWRKILVVCEGIYSMEGEISHLKEIVAICKKYKCYVYVDEAHSIGALGATGRGVTEKCGVDTADIDVLMGTFTKSFGGMGGYIAGSQELIDFIRATSAGTTSALPENAAASSAVKPFFCSTRASAPRDRRSSTMSACLKMIALKSVVWWFDGLPALTFAPASRARRTAATSPSLRASKRAPSRSWT